MEDSNNATYRSIDSIKKIFALLFENINLMKSDQPLYIINKQIKSLFVGFLNEISKDYCFNLDKLPVQAHAAGGAGAVGTFKIDQQRVYVNDVSFPSFGSFTPFNSAVVVKRNLHPENLFVNCIKLKNGKISMITNTQFHEILVSSIFSYIYDLDVCPHVTKFYGCYLCNNEFSLIEEANDITFFDLLAKYGNQLIYPDIQIFLFQLLFTFLVEKRVCGAINYDLHLSNIMFQVMKDNVFNLKTTNSDPIIQGLRANDCQYFAYEFKIDDKYYEVLVENLGLLVKIIDLGNVFVDLDNSGIDDYFNLHYPLELVGNLMRFPRFNEIHFERSRFYDTHEFCFVLLGLFAHLEVVINNFGLKSENLSVSDQEKIDSYNQANPIAKKLEEFILYINRLFGYSDDNIFASEMDLTKIREYMKLNTDRTFFNFRRVGLEGVNIKSLLLFYINLLRVDKFIGTETRILPNSNQEYTVERFVLNSRKAYNPAAKIIKISIIKGAVSLINPLKNFMRDYHKAYDANFKLPDRDENYYLKIDPRNVLEKPLILTQQLNYDNQTCQLTKFDGQTLVSTHYFAVKFVDLEPNNLNLNGCPADEFRIQPYHYSFDEKLPLLNEVGNLQSNIHFDYLEIEISKSRIIFTSPKGSSSMYSTAKDELRARDDGLVFNLGYFIVIDNIANILTTHYNLIAADYAKPIGYYYYEDNKYNGTLLQIPLAYQQYFAAIVVYRDGTIGMERYDQFLDRHETEDILELVMKLDNPTSFIPLVNRKIKFNRFKPIIKSGKEYRCATTTGPIAFWDSKLFFTRDLMLNSEFIFDRSNFKIASTNFTKQALLMSNNRKKADFIRYHLDFYPKNGTKFKVVDLANNNKMFTTDAESGAFIYGQRSSSNLHIISLIGLKENKLYYILSEGRGFSSLGIDRAQFAKIIESMKLEYAVFCDGGFSANAIIKHKGELKNLVQDPEGRRLSSICIVKEKFSS